MGWKAPPLYGEAIEFWADELMKAISKDDEERIQECLRSLSFFIKSNDKYTN